MYKTILVPIDLAQAEPGQKALRIARQIGGSGARIHLLHVMPEIPTFVSGELPKGLLDENMEQAAAALKELGGDGVEAKVTHGHPSREILDYAGKIGADLIVIASHQPGLQDYFLGSTAARVVRHAHCPVLVDR